MGISLNKKLTKKVTDQEKTISELKKIVKNMSQISDKKTLDKTIEKMNEISKYNIDDNGVIVSDKRSLSQT
jgi:uncharacterized coiled-coil protein SlyX